ncbi:PREDICTED: uncharacterized protein LOC105964552 [Erythranthe guttata]|uniref:uncharacterized protein LOC105964552 n=1 Tax=Erythranthe guttata TaxID=4155 RepID=UPI00064DE235|nr:PREDICTED: uncharacterized protein LOC105964552 [Erythranthe guttata]|eukprot:XP_012844515.1 PREDICTED: uncharacterized protein LOC105964552 [Erythranthe guttata]
MMFIYSFAVWTARRLVHWFLNMDKEWVKFDRRGKKYQEAARSFANAARARSGDSDMIVCPCLQCRNLQHHHFDIVYEHIVIKGFDPNYKIWFFHGERPNGSTQNETKGEPCVAREEDAKNLVRKAECPFNEVVGNKKVELTNFPFFSCSACTYWRRNRSDYYVAFNSLEYDLDLQSLRSVRVCEHSFGATPSKVNPTNLGINARVDNFEAMLKSLERRMDAFEAKLEALLKVHQQSEQESHSKPTDYQNAKCRLLHWYNVEAEEVVGEGHIVSVDPRAKVYDMPLGRDCCKVLVNAVFDEDLDLIRRAGGFKKLSEALGSIVAWPKSCIKLI